VAASGDESHYAAATEAEAHLLLGDLESAATAAQRAGALHGQDFAALASTRRQLRMVCDTLGIGPDVLSPLAGPAFAHFCGHRIAGSDGTGRIPPDDEDNSKDRMTVVAVARPAAFAYGSLPSGADIM
jgi:hypothetical protein